VALTTRIGIASKPIEGERVNGDAWFFKTWDGQTLLAVIDGLGHGQEAALASETARQYLIDNYSSDLEGIMQGLHTELHKTRGCVAGLVYVNHVEKKITHCGIGNIDVIIDSRPPAHPASLNGIVGVNIRKVLVFEYHYDSLRLVIMHSDGISSRFDPGNYPLVFKNPQVVAEQIMADWGKSTDDRLILIAAED